MDMVRITMKYTVPRNRRLVLEDLDKLLERHENRRRCRRFQERDMLTSILSRERN